MFALVDCNNFYASCERLFRPELNGKPVCVLSNNDGCVIARSNEAKAIGIPMGAPAFEWEAFFKANDVSVFSANFELYGDMSHRVMSVLSNFSPTVEVYSIDEIFLDFTGFQKDLLQEGLKMRHEVFMQTGIPVSVGFAPTKSLAKLSNRIAKKYAQLQNVYLIDSEEKRLKALKWLKIGDVWGIGRQHAKRLQHLNIQTAYDFTQLDEAWVRKKLSVVGLRLQRDLKGHPTIQMEEVAIKKSIATTRSFDKNYTTVAELKERIATFTVSCAEKLRTQDSECNALTVFIQSNRFRADLPQHNPSITIALPFASNSSIELCHFSTLALEIIFKSGYRYKKAGVIVSNLTPALQKQLTLFGGSNHRHKVLMKTIDSLNHTFGQQKVRLASQDQKKVWKMKQERLSPRYTTRLSDVVNIKC